MEYSITFPELIGVATIAAGMFGIVVQQRFANRRPFLEKQQQLLFEAVDTATRLTTEHNPVEWEIARRKFYHLLLALSVVMDQKVEHAMLKISDTMTPMPVSSKDLPMEVLRNPTYALAYAARDLMSSSWKIRLPHLVSRSEKNQK